MIEREIVWEANKIRNDLANRFPEYAAKLNEIRFQASRRMTSCAGMAYNNGTIKLSVPYFASSENRATHFHETVTHEIAHVLCPERGHGSAWRNVHRMLGGKGERCHRMELAQGFKSRPRAIGTCKVCNRALELGPVQFRRHLASQKQGGSGYMHKECGLMLRRLLDGGIL